MSMTRTDYELVARILKWNMENLEDTKTVESIAYNLIGAFGTAYSNFNPDTFKTACGIK
jgi:hypothetical protein